MDEEWEPLDEQELLQGDRDYFEDVSRQDPEVGRGRNTLPQLPSWRMPVRMGPRLTEAS